MLTPAALSTVSGEGGERGGCDICFPDLLPDASRKVRCGLAVSAVCLSRLSHSSRSALARWPTFFENFKAWLLIFFSFFFFLL